MAEGHNVRRAQDGEDGLRALTQRLPDLVLMDVDMPVLDGPGMAYRACLVEDCGRETIPVLLPSSPATPTCPASPAAWGTPYALAKLLRAPTSSSA